MLSPPAPLAMSVSNAERRFVQQVLSLAHSPAFDKIVTANS